MSRRSSAIIIGAVISIVALWITVRQIEFDKVAAALETANYWLLIPNIAIILLGMYQRAWRWRRMALPIKKVAFNKLLSATAVGFMANNVLPLRLGEFVRAYSLSKQDPDISKSASLAMIFTERIIFDLAALIGIFGLVLWTTSLDTPDQLKSSSFLILIVAFSGYFFAVVMAKWPEKISQFLHSRLSFLPLKARDFLRDAIERFSVGLRFMRSPLAGLSVLAQTALIWFALGLSNYFVFQAFSLNLPLEASFATLAVVSVWILVPAAPGFVGVYHAAVVFTLAQYGVERDTAFACAVVMHAAQYAAVTLFGLYHLWKGHLSLKEVEQEASGADV
jgi:glycosyltransferase 2 family protein